MDQQIIESKLFSCPLHRDVEAPLLRLRTAARGIGLDLAVASGYRSIDRQLLIWNAKACGERVVLDDCGEPLDREGVTDLEWVYAILRWSALPGASRHHWGCDVDIYDPSAMPEDYQLQLTVGETCAEGVFTALHRFLDEHLKRGDSEFYRPYALDRGGVAPEPWHLSYRPLAKEFQASESKQQLRQKIAELPLLYKDLVLEHWDDIYERFIVSAQA